MTKERILAALDKPKGTYAIAIVANAGGKVEEVQEMLLRMRDEGLVKFDINRVTGRERRRSRPPSNSPGSRPTVLTSPVVNLN
jgi:hypothetical protein